MMNNGTVVTNKNSPTQDPPVLNNETCWYENKAMERDPSYPDYNEPPNYPTDQPMESAMPPPYAFPRLNSKPTDKYLLERKRRRRNRQTCGLVFLGFVLLGLAATATALIIHFVFIKG